MSKCRFNRRRIVRLFSFLSLYDICLPRLIVASLSHYLLFLAVIFVPLSFSLLAISVMSQCVPAPIGPNCRIRRVKAQGNNG